MEIFTLLETLEDLLENSRSLPFSSKGLVDKEEMLDLIKEIRIKLPDELKQAKWVKEERQRILVEAQKEADGIVKEAENRILIPSPKVETYDLKPEMSAYEVTEKVIKAIKSQKYDCIILNYANPDMVGHTGNLEAAIKALETVDECVGKVVEAVQMVDGTLLITADHGNIEQMIDYKTGEPHTAHTTNPVPLILVGKDNVKLKPGKLADLAPTMLDIMGLEKPEEMTGESLIIK